MGGSQWAWGRLSAAGGRGHGRASVVWEEDPQGRWKHLPALPAAPLAPPHRGLLEAVDRHMSKITQGTRARQLPADSHHSKRMAFSWFQIRLRLSVRGAPEGGLILAGQGETGFPERELGTAVPLSVPNGAPLTLSPRLPPPPCPADSIHPWSEFSRRMVCN